jgi:DNA end-binding protein Ku
VSFGLVTIPIKIVPATENHNISFHQYHQTDMGRIRYRKICELDGQQLSEDEIGKGYEVSKDTIVEVTDEELAQMPLPTAKAIEIVAFVPAESIDPVRIGDSYHLAADGQVAVKPYTLLRQALGRSSKVAVASSPCAAGNVWGCCASKRTRWSCIQCTGPTRSAPPTSSHRSRSM